MKETQDNLDKTRTQWIRNFVRSRLANFLYNYADDICQEIQIKLLKADKRQGFKIENFGYIKQTSMSVMIDFMRKHKNNQFDESYENQLHDPHEPNSDPEQIIHNQKLLQRVNDIIMTFPRRVQTILLLYLRGMKINEIVELTGNNKSIVRNDIYRGKEKLLNTLNKQGIQYEI
jgi:RNA polymerase sigma factor (sigma-70 family)